MAEITEVFGSGIVFSYGDTTAVFTAPTSGWTATDEVTDIKLPQPEKDKIKTSHMLTTGRVHTYRSGWTEPGTAEVTLHYEKTVYSTLKALEGLDKNFRAIFLDGSGVGWTGYITGVYPETDIEGLVTTVIKFQVSGALTTIAALA